MKRLALLLTCLVAAVGCSHRLRVADIQDGVERSRVEGTISPLSTEITTTGSDVQMDVCRAGIGDMPNGATTTTCVKRVEGDEDRRARSLDWQANPYGAYQYAPLH